MSQLYIMPRRRVRKCCQNEQFWPFWRNLGSVGEDAPIFQRPEGLQTCIIGHPPPEPMNPINSFKIQNFCHCL